MLTSCCSGREDRHNLRDSGINSRQLMTLFFLEFTTPSLSGNTDKIPNLSYLLLPPRLCTCSSIGRQVILQMGSLSPPTNKSSLVLSHSSHRVWSLTLYFWPLVTCSLCSGRFEAAKKQRPRGRDPQVQKIILSGRFSVGCLPSRDS